MTPFTESGVEAAALEWLGALGWHVGRFATEISPL